MGRFIKGLHRDMHPADQPEGTWRYARNAIVNRVDGAISNERGTSAGPLVGLVPGYKVIGAIETTNDEVVLFSVNRYSWSNTSTDASGAVSSSTEQSSQYGRSEIGIIRADGSYSTLLNMEVWDQFSTNLNLAGVVPDTDLKFNASYPITGTYKISAEGDLFVYWTDNFNPPRSLNVSRQARTGHIPDEKYRYIYEVDFSNSINKNYVDRLNLFTHTGPVPNVDMQNVKSGGGLVTGTYSLALAYVDKDLTATNYMIVDNPVSIVEDVESVQPIERYDGAKAGSQSGKSILWHVNNINIDYEYLRPTVIQSIGDQKFAFQLHDIETSSIFEQFTGDSTNYSTGIIPIVFSGTEGYINTSVEDVIINDVSYSTAKTITQLDDVLYLGNLTGTKDVGFQQFASTIKLTPKVKELENFDPFSLITDNIENGFIEIEPIESNKGNGYRDPWNAYKMRGYMRGEVYSFYIAFILNDGSMSYAYHIPGRKAILDELDTLDADSSSYSNSAGISGLGDTKNFHFNSYSASDGSNDMNYWENSNETYPDTPAFNAPAYKNEDGSMAKVRHHHFPKNTNENYSTIKSSATSDITTAIPEAPTTDITLDNIAVTDNEIASLGFTWLDIHGEILNILDYGRFTAFHADFIPTVIQIGEFYNFNWSFESGAASGEYEGEVVSIQEDSNWILVSHEHLMLELNIPIFGTLISNLLSDALAAADWPNDTNLANFLGIPFEEGTMTLTGNSLPGECKTITDGGTISNTVRVLGFELSDIDIPPAIISKVQGFRIFYAKRDHKNKRTLGQGVVAPYIKKNGRLGGCPNNPGEGVSSSQNFWVKDPLDVNDSERDRKDYKVLSFYNFELLRTHDAISIATHVAPQWVTSFYNFLGPGVSHELDVDSACNEELIRSNFYVSKSFDTYKTPFYSILKERCKTYVEGNTILNASSAGFGYRLYNKGGETHIALGLNEPLAIINEENTQTFKANHTDFTTVYLNGTVTKAYTVNLDAFKTDVYSTIDSQNLVWTGFQVVGTDLNKFDFRHEDYTGTTNSVQTDPEGLYFTQDNAGSDSSGHLQYSSGIFGGDVFLCRYGVRQSLLPRISTMVPIDRVSSFLTIIESTDNINFRHEEGPESAYFPGASIKESSLNDRDGKNYDSSKFHDLSSEAGIKYNSDYSGVNDTNPAFALPNLVSSPTSFTTRVQRSAKSDPGSLRDNFRVFLANDYKDMPKNRGSLWNLAAFNNLLYIHMEDSLLLTKGKQSMKLTDGSQAFIGSGDIFAQAPDELLQTEEGYGGTRSQFSTLTTKFGYFFVDQRNNKVFLATDKLTEISKLGMESWFKENLGHERFNFGLSDSPILGVGYVSGWDERNKRILLTKRALLPSNEGKDFFTPYRTRSDGEGKIFYDGATKSLKFKVYPSVSSLQNGDFEYGNQMLPIVDFSDASNFSSTQVTSTNFFWTISQELTTRALSSGEFTMSYSKNNPFITLSNIVLDANTSYIIDIEWKGAKGIKAEITGSSPTTIFKTTVNQSGYTTTRNSFTTDSQTKQTFKIYGGVSTDDETLYIKSVSVKDAAISNWDHPDAWLISGKSITHRGADISELSQNVNGAPGRFRRTVFTVSKMTQGELHVLYGNKVVLTCVEDGTYDVDESWISEESSLIFRAVSDFDGTLDNITCVNLSKYKYLIRTTDTIIDTETFSAENDGDFIDIDIPAQLDTTITKFIEAKGSEPTLDCTNCSSRDYEYNQTPAGELQLFNRVGWTISYYPEYNMWGSFHDYLPHLYTYTSGDGAASTDGLQSFFNWEELPDPFWTKLGYNLSINEGGSGDSNSFRMWGHNNPAFPGAFYFSSKLDSVTVTARESYTYPFEVEGIINSPKERDMSKTFSNISYETEVFDMAKAHGNSEVRYKRLDKDGFTSFFVYNSTQHSSNIELIYLKNIRKVAHKWQINKFRDMANLIITDFVARNDFDGEPLQEVTPVAYAPNTVLTSGFIGVNTSGVLDWSGIGSAGPTGAGAVIDWVGEQDVHDMFEATWGTNGIYAINTHNSYINLEKPWHQQKKFVDTYLGIRVISNNFNGNFVNLYSFTSGMRKYIR